MEHCQALAMALLAAVCLLPESSGHYFQSSSRGRLYSPSRYGSRYHSGYPTAPDSDLGLRTIFRTIYFKNKADGGGDNVISGGGGDGGGDDGNVDVGVGGGGRVVIRLPSSIVNNPNFKTSDLPFYLSSGLFDPNNLPGPLGGSSLALPTPIVDPVNPSFGTGGVLGTDDLLGGANNILGVANTNLLGGANTNLLGVANTNLLGGANTNLLGVANTNLLGGANTNLGGANTNRLGGTSGNLLGGANTNVLGGGTTGLLGQGNSNTDFFSTKTGGSSDLFGNTLTG